ncbi:MAG: ABC transporter permease subunit [Sedimentisphaerales bacterium]|nr:ABC transporter permease subunit [Sedimentisphaerales bacterium]
MTWKIAAREFLLNLMTFKFVVGTILCIVLVAVFVPVLAEDYRQRLRQYDERVADNEARLRQVKAYRVLTPTVYRRPQVLSVFSQGMEKRLGDSARIDFGAIPQTNAGPAEVNPYLSIFPTFDVLLIFKIVMSALALLVAYDTVSREKEQGTLSLILAHPLARGHVLLGKLVAGSLTLAVPATVAFLIGLLLLSSSRSVILTGGDWARILMMYVASLLFVLSMYNIGLLFSCLTRSSALALVLGLFFWVLAVAVVPDGSAYLARRLQPAETVEARDEQIASLSRQFREDFSERLKNLPGGGDFESDAEGPFDAYGPLGGVFNYYATVCTPVGLERWIQRVQSEAALKTEYADKIREVARQYAGSQIRQAMVARRIGMISPACLYDNVMSALAGTDVADFQSWAQAATAYRDVLIAYIRNKTDNLRSPSYVTQSTEAERIAWEKGPDSERRTIKEAVDRHTLPLNLEDLPRFEYATHVGRSLRRAGTDLMLLAVFNVLFFASSFAAFQEYDVR